MTLRGKLLSGFGMMLLLLLIQGVFSGLMFRQSQQLEQSVSTVELPLVLEVLELRELLYQTEGALNGWILSGEESFREQYRTLWTRVMEKNSQIEVSTLDLEILLLKRKQDEAFVLAHTLEGEPAKELFQNKLLPNAKEVQSAARRLLFYERRRAQGDASFQSLKQSKMLVYTLSNFQRSFSELLALLNTVLLSGDRDGERRFIKHWRENQGAWVALNRAELTTQQQAEMGRIRAVRQHFHQDALKMIELRMDPKWNLAAWKVSQEVSLLLLQVVEQVDELVSQRTEQMNQGFERHAEMMDEGGKVVWLFLVVALLTVLLTARALILRIYRPIQRVQQVFQEILSKDYHSPIKVESNDEMGVLLMSLKEMREQLRDAEIDEQASRSALLNQKFALDQAANVSATDLDGVIVYVNQRMLDLTGYSEEEVIGERHDLFKSGIHDESFYREMWDTMSAGLVWHGEICDRTKDGDLVWLDTTIVPFLGENMQPIEYMAIRNDVTLIKESEQRIREEQERTIAANHDLQHSMQRLQETQQQLVESEKMASLGGLVAGIAHEVNTPLGIGVTAASYLKDQTDQLLDQYQQKTMKRSALEQYLKGAAESTSIVLDNLMRASGLVKSFKQVAVDQSSDERRSFHLQPYLNDILRSLHPKLKKLPHQVLIEGSEEIEVMNDPGAFSQVITNLVMNSVIHGLDDEVAGTITMTIDEDDERVTLLYQDDGRGASAEVVEKIFEPFFTTRRGEGGSGLGMHLVYNLITQKMKGGIECQSKPGEGMSFQISLPK